MIVLEIHGRGTLREIDNGELSTALAGAETHAVSTDVHSSSSLQHIYKRYMIMLK